MTFFSRQSSEPSPPAVKPRSGGDGPAPERRKATTYIATGSRVNGEITGGAEVLVDGEVHGQLRLESGVTVGREGRVQGEIQARSVRIDGKVAGNVRGLDLVEVAASGSLEGDIAAARVVIAEGAFFKGSVEMNPELGKRAPERPSEPSGSPSSPPAGAAGPGAGGAQRKGGR